jgi:hypothetical protein
MSDDRSNAAGTIPRVGAAKEVWNAMPVTSMANQYAEGTSLV